MTHILAVYVPGYTQMVLGVVIEMCVINGRCVSLVSTCLTPPLSSVDIRSGGCNLSRR